MTPFGLPTSHLLESIQAAILVLECWRRATIVFCQTVASQNA